MNPHAATQVGSRTLGYDPNGNLTSDAGGPASITNTWNYRNELTNTTIAQTSVNYGYDVSGQRISLREQTGANIISTNFPTPSFSETTRVDGTLERTVSIETAGLPVATIRTVGTSTPEAFATHTDHLRSTRLVTSEASGLGTVNIVEQTDYDPFGKITRHEQSGDFAERKKYTSHEFDSATNYTYAKARYLDTEMGRFISQDPKFVNNPEEFLSDPQQLNSYSYARNNPVKYIDPDGKKVELVSRPIHGNSRDIGPGVLGAHAFLLMTPQNPDTIGTIQYTDANKNFQSVDTSKPFTLGAYTDGSNLFKAVNGDIPSTDCRKCASITVAPPKGVSQENFESNIVSYYNSLPDELSSTYHFGGIGWNTNPNSNNAATNLLTGVGISRAKIDHYYQSALYVQNLKVVPGLGEPLGSATAYSRMVNTLDRIGDTLSRIRAAVNNRYLRRQ